MSSDGGKVELWITSKEDAKVYAALAKLIGDVRRTGAECESASTRAVKLTGDLAAFAREVQRIPTGGVDNLTSKMEKLRALFKEGAISPEQFKAAEAKFRADDQAPLRKFAQEQIAIDTTPLQVAQAKWQQLRDAVAAELMTEQQFSVAAARLHTEYQQQVAKSAEARNKAAAMKPPGASGDPMAPNKEAAAAWNAQIAQIKAADDELQAFADRIKKLDETPAERLAAKMQRLEAATSKGKLTQDEFGRAAKRAQDEYQAELEQTDAKQRQIKGSAGAADSSVAQFASGLVSRLSAVVGVAATARKVFDEMRQAADAAGQSVQQSREGLGALGQFAPQMLPDLVKQAKELRAQGAAESIDAAAKMLFSLRSAGAEQSDVRRFAEMSKFGLVNDPATMARSAAAMQTALGKDQAGSLADIVGRAFTASKYTPATAEQLVQGAAKAGSFAKTQGVGIESLLSGTAILSSAKGSAEEGGSRLAALLRQTSLNPELRGLELPQLVDRITEKKLSPEKLKELLSDSEAIDALQIVAGQREVLRTALQDFAANRGTDQTASRLRAVQNDPGIRAAAELRQRQGELEVARYGLGVSATEMSTQFTRARLAAEARDQSALGRGVENATISSLQFVGGAAPDLTLRGANRFGGVGQLSELATGALFDPRGAAVRFGVAAGRSMPEMQREEQRQRGNAEAREWGREQARLIEEQRQTMRAMREAAEAQRKVAEGMTSAMYRTAPRREPFAPVMQAQHARAAE